jgi:uncharacterized RDD family membrane protein YckC
MEEQEYPGVSLRAKAVVADGVMLITFIIMFTYLFSLFENVADAVRISAFIFVFILYDPIFTSSFGGTIGHYIFGIRVKRESNQERNILFPLAIVRFLLKAILGWISLLTVSKNPRGKAIHDSIVGSVVLYSE